jgi:Flp pilus assembly protein TadG
VDTFTLRVFTINGELMKTKGFLYEKGQTLVVFVLGFFAFVALLALVLDGGNAYAAKRQAQNAADAGALAGATYMCKYKDEDGGRNTAEDYAVKNGAVDPPQVYVSLSSGTVEVTATVQRDTSCRDGCAAGGLGVPCHGGRWKGFTGSGLRAKNNR